MKNKNILIVAAHPDDEILGCGGTISKLANNNEITVIILVNAITSRSVQPSDSEILEANRNAIEAQEIIGINKCYFENLPDNRLDELALLDIVKIVSEFITKIKPIPNIHSIIQYSGTYNLYISIFCESPGAARELIYKIKTAAGKHLKKLVSYCHAGFLYRHIVCFVLSVNAMGGINGQIKQSKIYSAQQGAEGPDRIRCGTLRC